MSIGRFLHQTWLAPVAARPRLFAVLALLAGALLPVFNAQAQSYLTEVGDTTFRTTLPVELGYYDASTGNLHLEIPLGTWPERGSHPFTAALVYDSRIWYVNGNTWQPTNVPNSMAGWRLVTTPALGGSITYKTNTYQCQCDPPYPCKKYYYVYNNFTWTDAYGTVRTFPVVTERDRWACDIDEPSGSQYANDSSGYLMNVSNYTTVSSITTPDGTQVYPGYKDSNGNYFSTDANGNVIDTLGRTPVTVTTNCNGYSTQICYDVLNSQGTRSRYTVTTVALSVHTAFGQSGVTEYSGTITAFNSIQLPDGSTYGFTYDSASYGELTGVTLPTHGSVTYGYSTYFDDFNNANRWLHSRTSGGGTWTYAPSILGSCAAGYTKCQEVWITKPSSNQVLYVFNTNSGSNGSWLTGQTYYWPQAASISTSWTSTNNYAQKLTVTSTFSDSPSPHPTKTVQYTYGNPALPLVSKISEWNYYPAGSQPTNPDRVTSLSYYMGHPTTITVTNGAGTQTIAQTNVTYDAYGANGLTPVTGVVQHDDANFGTGFTARGNPTSIAKLVSGSTYLTTAMTYDTTGQLTAVTDPANNQTLIGYTDSFYNDNNANPPSSYAASGPTNAYPTRITPPIIGPTTLNYYYGTGQPAFSTDQNSQTAYDHYYDPFSRPTETILPDGGWVLGNYVSTTEADSYVGITSSAPSTSCTSCRRDQTLLDTLGRVQYQNLVSDPDGQTTVQLAYDTSGRATTVTNPYRGTVNGQDTNTYDALDRVVSTTHTDNTSVTAYYGNS